MFHFLGRYHLLDKKFHIQCFWSYWLSAAADLAALRLCESYFLSSRQDAIGATPPWQGGRGDSLILTSPELSLHLLAKTLRGGQDTKFCSPRRIFLLAKTPSRKEILVHSYPPRRTSLTIRKWGQLPPDPPRRTGQALDKGVYLSRRIAGGGFIELDFTYLRYTKKSHHFWWLSC